MINRGRTILCAALIFAASAAAYAADIETRFERDSVAPGETTILSVRISGSGDVEPGEPAPVDGLSISYRGNVSSFEFVNGRSWSGIVIQYAVTPAREGRFTVPPFAVKAGGKVIYTKAATFTASGSAVSRRPRGFPGFPQIPFPDMEQGDDPVRPSVRVDADCSKRSVWAGEPVIVRYRASTQTPVTFRGFEAVPEIKGCVRKDLDSTADLSPGTGRILSFILIPQSAGEAVVGRGSAVFTDDNGWGPFSKIVSEMPPFSIAVRALPSEGRPEDFSGSVGIYTLMLDSDRLSCAAYEERRIAVTVSGTGNFFGLQAPSFPNIPSEIKVIPSEEKESVSAEQSSIKGEKKFTLTVVPEREGDFDLGPLSFSYFDPSQGIYRTAVTAPVHLTVSGVSHSVKDQTAPSTKSYAWIIVLFAVAAVLSAFAGILWYERKKYGVAAASAPEEKKEEQPEPRKNVRSDLSRLKYDLAVARERNDPKLFLSSAEKILSFVGSTDGAAAVKDELFALKYGGRLCTKEMMAELEEKILALSGY